MENFWQTKNQRQTSEKGGLLTKKLKNQEDSVETIRRLATGFEIE